MKNYKVISKEIKKNSETIKSLNEQADKLLKKAELDACGSFWGGTLDVKKYQEVKQSITEENEQKAIELLTQADELTKVNLYLNDNLKASFLEYASGVIKEVCKPYIGKPLGDKTREKIREQARKKGVSLAIGDNYRPFSVATVGGDGYLDYVVSHIDLYSSDSDGKMADCYTENKLNDLENITLKNSFYKYTDNPKQAIKKINKAMADYKKALAKATQSQQEINSLLPSNKNFDIVGYWGENSFRW